MAPKYVKVVANSKKLVAIMRHTEKHFPRFDKFPRQNAIKKRTLEWVIYNVKDYLNPRWRLVTIELSSKSCMCYVLETGLTRIFAADLSLQIFNNH